MVAPTSIFLGITFFGAGMAKLYADHAYFGWIGPVWLEERLEPYGLALYARFIAFSQILIGYMLLTLRYRTLGAIMAVPLIINILLVTISLEWRGTPYVLSVLLLMNLYLLWMDRDRLLPIIGHTTKRPLERSMSIRGHLMWIIGLMLTLISIEVSDFHLQIGWVISMIGITISFLAKRWDEKSNDVEKLN